MNMKLSRLWIIGAFVLFMTIVLFNPQGSYAQLTTTTWYLAEGSTSGYDTWILVQNPNTSDANVTITFMDADGTTVTNTTTVQANSRYSVKINDVDGMNNKSGVSTTVQSTNNVGIIAERAMYWDSGGIENVGGHCSIGVQNTATTWYLAEGSTNGFDTWVLVQNPNASAAAVTITFMDQDGNTATETTTVSANSRYSIKINDVTDMNNKAGVSTKVQSTNNVGVIVERAMYWDSGSIENAGGHCTAGVTGTAANWYLAEGSTNGYDTWILVQNPSASTATINLVFMDTDGNTVTESQTMAANSRYSRNINAVSGMNNKSGVSTRITSTNGVGVIAERAMYWDSGDYEWIGGHCSAGVTGTATTWYLAEGSTSGYDTWVLIQNPNSSSAVATLTFMDQDGNTVEESVTIAANSRYSRNINAVSGMNNKSGVSTEVASSNSVRIIVERAMYWDSGGIENVGGHCSKGATNAALLTVYSGRNS